MYKGLELLVFDEHGEESKKKDSSSCSSNTRSSIYRCDIYYDKLLWKKEKKTLQDTEMAELLGSSEEEVKYTRYHYCFFQQVDSYYIMETGI